MMIGSDETKVTVTVIVTVKRTVLQSTMPPLLDLPEQA